MGPSSYNVEDAYKKTQLKNPKFFIGKGPIENYLDLEIKKGKKNPAVGHYKIDSAIKMTTKGLARGWK